MRGGEEAELYSRGVVVAAGGKVITARRRGQKEERTDGRKEGTTKQGTNEREKKGTKGGTNERKRDRGRKGRVVVMAGTCTLRYTLLPAFPQKRSPAPLLKEGRKEGRNIRKHKE
jgi:hypothetical protein